MPGSLPQRRTTLHLLLPLQGSLRDRSWTQLKAPFPAPSRPHQTSCSLPPVCMPAGNHGPGPSLGFSRQEHWSGLPFPSPMHESEVAQSCPTLCNPIDSVVSNSVTPWGYTVYGILQDRIVEWVAFPFSRGSSQPRDPTQVSCTSTGSLASQRHPGKFPKVPGRSRGTRGFPAAPRQRPRESFFNASRGPSPLP